MLFATSNYGASGFIGMIVIVAFLILCFVVSIGYWYAIQLVRKKDRGSRLTGIALFTACTVLFFGCYYGPSLLHRFEYGAFPIGTAWRDKIAIGMTKDHVRRAVGSPQEFDGNRWYYYVDAFSISILRVDFGSDDRVEFCDTD